MRYLSNAFAISMLDGRDSQLWIRPISPQTIKRHLSAVPWQSAMGHADIARLVGLDIGIDVPVNRVSLKLGPQDYLYVAQYMGPRLPEGTTELPDGSSISYFLVTVTPSLSDYDSEFRDGSIYGSLYKRAQDVADLVGGSVSIKQDHWGNIVFVVDALGFHAELRDE